jgi:hypothetical protein
MLYSTFICVSVSPSWTVYLLVLVLL